MKVCIASSFALRWLPVSAPPGGGTKCAAVLTSLRRFATARDACFATPCEAPCTRSLRPGAGACLASLFEVSIGWWVASCARTRLHRWRSILQLPSADGLTAHTLLLQEAAPRSVRDNPGIAQLLAR